MNKSKQFVVFFLDNQKYALSLPDVKRAVRAVEITSLPEAPEIVSGVINIQGLITPVINIRKRFRLQEKEIDPKDRFIIADTSKRLVVLMVDEVEGVIESKSQEIVTGEKILPGMEYVEGVLKLEDGIVFIHDLSRFLSLEEDQKLDDAMVKKLKHKLSE
ncbi:MAG: chemotaxis protein CheW [Thermodesulfobacteriota bacterium]|nr:chemotaxis protein CheW [Thermodesulfobacteriota bacterium]